MKPLKELDEQTRRTLIDSTLGDVGLYRICECLHMSHTGSGDPVNIVSSRRMCDYLRARLVAWSPTKLVYDEAMRMLVVATLSEQEP